MKKNEPQLMSASYFWPDAINAFIFCHGLMTVTLADVFMLSILNIIGLLTPYDLLNKGSHMLQIKECGGWSGYISKHMKTGLVNDKEHAAFLDMWLEKFIF